jgi:ATP-binding cassette, subfamily B, multidrug efflux pump
MRPYFRQIAGELLLGSLCGIAMNTMVVLPAILLGRAIDQVLALERGQGTAGAAGVAAIVFVLGNLATEVPRMGKRWWLQTANFRLMANVRADAFRGVLDWPMSRLHRTPIGDLMARTVGDVEVLGRGLREFTIETWDTLLFSASFVAAMAFYDPGLTALALSPVPAAMIVAGISGRWIAGRTTLAREVNAKLTASIQENLSGVRVLRLFGRAAAAVDQVAALSRHYADANLALIRLKSGLQPAYSTLMAGGIVWVVWIGGQRVIAGGLTVGVFVAYLELFRRFVERAYRFPQMLNTIQSAAAAYKRLEPMLAPALGMLGEPRYASFRPSHLMRLSSNLPTPPPGQREAVAIRLCRATFTYPGALEPAFRDVTLDVPAGSLVAVTGPVGAGKSALARCLAGIYPPDSGDILLDGEPAHKVASRLVGYAPQDGYLFSGSVKANVFLGGEALPAADKALPGLIDLAGLQEDVALLPNGVETQIGELGVRISGGQRQRLGLARAAGASVPKAPGLLVLDDPFSAVDVDTEARIIATLRRTFGSQAPADRRTTIVLFSHRLAAFSEADMVVVLTHGTIEERGTHQELLQTGGLYSHIYRAQLQIERGAASGALAR